VSIYVNSSHSSSSSRLHLKLKLCPGPDVMRKEPN